MSGRFDEQDAFVIFDDVEVPRDRVFIDGDVALLQRRDAGQSWWPNIMQQTMIRAEIKLDFAWALGTRMTEAINASGAGDAADAGRNLDLSPS